MRKFFLRVGSLLAMLAVILGAFGSHSLREILEPEQLRSFEIGVRYHFLHALSLFGLGVLGYYRKNKLMTYGGYAIIGGVVLFSGSLYLLSLDFLFNLPSQILGPITPIGGLFFIIGWGLIFLSTYSENSLQFKPTKDA